MKTILIIADQKNDYPTILKNSFPEYKILLTSSGKKGLEIASNESVDTIILKNQKPDFDGYKICILLKENASTSNIPVILFSPTKSDPKSRVKGLKCGANAYLSAPIDPDELVVQIEIMLRVKEVEDELKVKNLELEKMVQKKTIEFVDSQEKYKALYENAPLPYQSLNEDGSFNDVNPAWLNTLGYSREEVIGAYYKDFLHPDWEVHFEENFPKFKERGYVHDVSFKIRHKKGHYLEISFEGCIGYNPDGSFRQTYCVFQDVTERNKIQREMSISKERFDLAINAAQDGLYDWNLVDNTIYYSPSWKRMLGYSDEELPNDFSIWESNIHKSYVERSWKMQNELINKERDRFEMEFKMKHKDGHWVDILSRAEAVFDESGKAVRVVGTHVDISERKKAEKDLKQKQYYLSKSQEMGKIGTWELDIVNNKLTWTDENYRVFGIPVGTEMTYDLFLDCIHPDDRDYVNKEWMLALDNKPYDIEHRLIVDGEVKWVREKADLTFDKKGKAISAIGFTQDISSQKEKEKEITDNEYKFGLLANNTTDFEYWIDENGKYVYLSSSCEKITGYKVEEYLNKHTLLQSLALPKYKDYVCDHFKKGIEHKSDACFEFEIKHKNGEIRWIEHSCTQVKDKDGVYKGRRGTNRDITARKVMEQEIHISEERYRSLMQNLPVGVFRSAFDGSILSANPAMAKIYGYGSVEELLEVSALDLYSAADTRNTMLAELKEKGTLLNYETIELKKDGSQIWVSINYKAIYDGKGNIKFIEGVIVDITDQKRAKEDLEKSEVLYRSIFQASFIGFWITDMKGNILVVNEAYCKMTKFSENELLKMHVSQIDINDNKKIVEDRIVNIVKNKHEFFESQHRTKKGKNIDVEVSLHYQDIEGGRIICFFNDITEQKKAFDNLILNKKRIETLLRLNQMSGKSLDDIYEFTLEKAVELTNSKFGFLGFPNKDETKVDIYNWSGEAMKECMVQENTLQFIVEKAGIWGEVIRSRKPMIINDFEKPNPLKKGVPTGHVKIHNYLSIPVFSGNKIVAIVSVANKGSDYQTIDKDQLVLLLEGMWNFVQRKRIQEDLQIAKVEAEFIGNKYSTLISTMSTAFALHEMIFDENYEPVDYRFIETNKAWSDIVGIDSDSVIGKTIKELIPDIENTWLQSYGRVVKSGIAEEFEEFNAATNKYYHVYAYRPVSGQFAVLFNDITSRKEDEKELIHAKEKAEESDRLKSAFLATMSHELRTPLNAIIGFSDIITPKTSIDKAVSYGKIINSSGNQLLGIVDDLFDITLIESGQSNVSIDNVNIDYVLRLLNKSIKADQDSLNKEDISISFVESDIISDLEIETDKTKFKQVLTNLLRNSLKFTEKGYIKYGYVIKEVNKQREVEFYVEDTGIGVPIEKQDIVFERFRQLDDSHTRLYGGVGLGLAISKKLVELLGGRIWLDTNYTKGARFCFTIPIVKTQSETKKIENPEGVFDKDYQKYKILIVEDDESSYDYLQIILSDIGFETFWSENGIEAIEVVKKRDIDLILMDINMPELNGVEATKIIKKLNPKIPIIAQTAYAIAGDKERFLDSGCDDYISKPIKRDLLLSKISSLL